MWPALWRTHFLMSSLPLEPSSLLFPSETPAPSLGAPGMVVVAWPPCSPACVSPQEDNRNPLTPDSPFCLGFSPPQGTLQGMIPEPRGIKEMAMPHPSHFCCRHKMHGAWCGWSEESGRDALFLQRCSVKIPAARVILTWAYWHSEQPRG